MSGGYVTVSSSGLAVGTLVLAIRTLVLDMVVKVTAYHVYFLLVLHALVGAAKESIPTPCGEVVVQRSQLSHPATPISVVVASYFKCPDLPFTCAWRKHVR